MNVASTPISADAPNPLAVQKSAVDAGAAKPLADFNALLSLLIGGPSADQDHPEPDSSSTQTRGASSRKEDGLKKGDSLPGLSSDLLALVHNQPSLPPPPPSPGSNDNALPASVAQDGKARSKRNDTSAIPPELDNQAVSGNSNVADAANSQLLAAQAVHANPNPVADKRTEFPAADGHVTEDAAPLIAKTSSPSSAPIAFGAHLSQTRGPDKQSSIFSKGKDTQSALPGGSHGQGATPPAPVRNSKGSDQNANLNQGREKPQSSAKLDGTQKDGSTQSPPSDSGTSAGSASPTRQTVPNSSRETSKSATEPSATADSALAESKSDTNPKLRPQPAREISLRLPGGDGGGVDLRVTERAGKVQVTVRSADEALSHSLRSDLGDLVGRLEKKGFTTETWVPGDKAGQLLTNTESGGAQADPGKQQHAGDGAEQGGGGRHQGQNRQPRWMNDAETNFSIEEEGEMN